MRGVKSAAKGDLNQTAAELKFIAKSTTKDAVVALRIRPRADQIEVDTLMTEGMSICLVAEVRATILVQRSIVSSGVTQVAERDCNIKTDVKLVAEQLHDN